MEEHGRALVSGGRSRGFESLRARKAHSVTTPGQIAEALFEPRGTIHKLRNAALFAVRINFGLRRVEIHELRREHVSVEWSKKLKERALTIHESKADQEAKGATLTVGAREVRQLCVLRAVEDCLAATDGRLGEGTRLFPKMRGEVIYPEPMSLRTF